MKQTNEFKYVIIENLEDHNGYNGQLLAKVNNMPDNYFCMEDAEGNQWDCGEEEIKEVEK